MDDRRRDRYPASNRISRTHNFPRIDYPEPTMKLSMNQQDLQRAADRAHSIIQSSVPNNYEKYMLLEASENLLSLRTTSDTTEVVATCPAEVAEPGSALVDGDAFHRIARRSPPDSSIDISTNSEVKKSETGPGSRLLIQAGRTNFDISVHPKEGFPEPSKQDFENAFRVQGSELIGSSKRPAMPPNPQPTSVFI